MKIRFGFVAHALPLWNASPAKTLTFTRYAKMTKTERHEKLLEVTASNLRHTKRILFYCAAHEVPLYRLSSSLVPLATHPEVLWDFVTPFQNEWEELGRLIRSFSMRVSFHPSQFTLFTSPKKDITDNSIRDMDYHYRMLKAMGMEKEATMNIHIGGAYGDKQKTLVNFHQNLSRLPQSIHSVMTLENDDKTYNAIETLTACKKEGIPMVFDLHHHLANPSPNELDTFLSDILDTWSHMPHPPKIHLSSPKDEKAFRSHADYVDLEFIRPFFLQLKSIGRNVDFMIEAKAKDLAMFKLIEELSSIRGVKRMNGGTLEWN
ncbi:MAG TPA: UV DNA damage repair endonuclease UvsE [Chondromyces sp.]|nr:UV DNA damage repair endonuclease UvsE [Chondromyces sp.]